MIGHAWQGRGYARRAAQLLLVSLGELGVTQVVAHIHPAHIASQRIARHLNLVPTDTVVDGEVRWIGRTSADRAERAAPAG